MLVASAPGLVAAATLGLQLAVEELGWQPDLGPFSIPLGWLAVASPVLVLAGTATLVVGTLAARRVPGRPTHKWAILAVGLLAWAVAGYWLSVPGLIELP